jgi:hypothetical protein
MADHLAGIDAPLAKAGSKSVLDSEFEVNDNVDQTKKMVFEVSPVDTATTRTVNAANRDVNLGNITQEIVEVVTLLAGDITAKQITLSNTPKTAAQVKLTPLDPAGPAQENGVDFSVSGTTLSWNALGLDGVLEANDKIEVRYLING